MYERDKIILPNDDDDANPQEYEDEYDDTYDANTNTYEVETESFIKYIIFKYLFWNNLNNKYFIMKTIKSKTGY